MSRHPTPRVFVTCLAAYNNGTLHGEWVDATDEDDLTESVERILASSPIADAEEFFWSDTEGFGNLVSEYTSIKTTAAVGALVEKHGLSMVEFVADYAGSVEDTDELERLIDEVIAYSIAEEWPTERQLIESWAEERASDMGCDIPNWLQVDWEATGRDLLMDYHWEVIDGQLLMLPPGT